MAKKGKVSNLYANEVEDRPIRFRKYKQLFLIVCEDQNTERYYFETFKAQIKHETIFLRSVGTGLDPQGVAQQAIIERDKLASEAKTEVDIVYIVFDKDDADANEAKIARFSTAFDIAAGEKIRVAYSNEVFELWLLLHLVDIDPTTPLPRKTVYSMLEENVRNFELYAEFEYEHGNSNIIDIIANIGNEQAAIERAEMLVKICEGIDPILANPSTMVHLLVKELNGWISFYNYEP